MKHYSGIDYEHFLDDIRDMYPFNIEEAILVELIANSLDAKTTLLDIRIDPDRKTFQLVDNGSGMDVRGFDNYHNFSTSFKRKGQGIGFAGLGAKLSLRIAERVITESRSTKTWRASEWRFERKRRSSLPVWFDLDERTLPHNGTSVRMELKGRSERIGLVRDADGSLLGARPEHPQRPESDTAPHKLVDGMREPLEEAPRREQALQPSGENAADRRASHANFGPLIRHHDAPDRDAMSWMEGDTIYINTAHPAYGKAAERKFLDYHELLTIALAMVREVPTSQERIDLLEQFMIRWGKV